MYSFLNSDSIVLSLRSSQLSSKAVNSGSLEDKAIKDGEESALYALILACEWRSESCVLDMIHSSQPHLKLKKIDYSKFFNTTTFSYLVFKPIIAIKYLI